MPQKHYNIEIPGATNSNRISTRPRKPKSNAGRLNPKPKLTEKTEQPDTCSSASHRGHQKNSLAPL